MVDQSQIFPSSSVLPYSEHSTIHDVIFKKKSFLMWNIFKGKMVKTQSKEPKVLLYISHARPFPHNNFFIQMIFWMIFFATCYEKLLELPQ